MVVGPESSEEAWHDPDNPWAIAPEQTTFYVPWRGRSAPTERDVERFIGAEERIEQLDAGSDEVNWASVFAVPGMIAPVLAWVEAARESRAAAVGAFVVGLETILDPADPFQAYVDLVGRLARSDVAPPEILDASMAHWIEPGVLRLLRQQEAPPCPFSALWTMHAVSRDDGKGTVWLHTHGLARCGMPELEMLEVPADCREAAATLLDDVAALLVDGDIPPPRTPLEVGPGLPVTLVPWQEVAPFVDAGEPGGPHDREGDAVEGHTGVRAVVCDPEPRGTYRAVYGWPKAAVTTLKSGRTCVYRSGAATERRARLAQVTVPQLRQAFTAAEPVEQESGSGGFAFKAGFDAPEGPREHLWFELLDARDHALCGRLANEPISDIGHKRGQILWVEVDRVSDWNAMVGGESIGPTDAHRLRADGERS